MDIKNTLAAVSLSAAIIVIWGLFMQPSPQEIKEAQLEKEKNEITQNEDAPKLIENEEVKIISRKNAINQSDRIIFENQNIIGSISLNGAVIDDLTLGVSLLFPSTSQTVLLFGVAISLLLIAHPESM